MIDEIFVTVGFFALLAGGWVILVYAIYWCIKQAIISLGNKIGE